MTEATPETPQNQPIDLSTMQPFGAVLGLKTKTFDLEAMRKTLLDTFKVELGQPINDEKRVKTEEGDADLYVTEWDNCLVFIAHVENRVPEALYDKGLRLNYRLNEGDVPHYTAHHSFVRVTVFPRGHNKMSVAKILLYLVLSLAGSDQVAYGFINDVLHSEQMLKLAKDFMVESGSIPWPVLIWVGLYNNEDQSHNAYTVGMEMFEKRNFEIMHSQKDYQTLFEVMINLCAYVAEHDITMNPGDTVEYTETENIRLGLAPSQSYLGEVLTLSFEPVKA